MKCGGSWSRDSVQHPKGEALLPDLCAVVSGTTAPQLSLRNTAVGRQLKMAGFGSSTESNHTGFLGWGFFPIEAIKQIVLRLVLLLREAQLQ